MAAAKTAAPDTTEDTAAAVFTPTKGGLVIDSNGRIGIVVDLGREPDEKLKESPEPLVAWFEATPAAPFGGELRSAS